MICWLVKKLLPLQGDLPGLATGAVNRHLRRCPGCAAETRAFSRSREISRQLAEGTAAALPVDLAAEVRARIENDPQERRKRSWGLRGYAAAAVLVIAGIGALSIHLLPPGEVEAPAPSAEDSVEKFPGGIDRSQLMALVRRLNPDSPLPGAGPPPLVESISFPKGTHIIYQADPETTVVWIISEEM